jgi:hypothetical protein
MVVRLFRHGRRVRGAMIGPAALARTAAACALACALSAFPDATVVSGGGPDFPLEIDSAYFFAWRDSAGTDSLVKPLPKSLYTELRDNIDSAYNYATALSMKRTELSGCKKGRPYASCLSFYTLGTPSVKVLFMCGEYGSAKLLTATDRYPFVVKFTKGFEGKLRKIAGKK